MTRQQKNSEIQCKRDANAQSNKGEKEKEFGPEIPQAANAICHFDLRLQFCNRCQTNSGLTSDKQNFPTDDQVSCVTSAVANCASSWHVATAEVGSAYKAFSMERIMGRVGVYIGLDHANITLDAMPLYYNEVIMGIATPLFK